MVFTVETNRVWEGLLHEKKYTLTLLHLGLRNFYACSLVFEPKENLQKYKTKNSDYNLPQLRSSERSRQLSYPSQRYIVGKQMRPLRHLK